MANRVRSETNLKIKQSHPSTASLTNPQAASLLRGHLMSEAPNSSLYTYDGTLHLSSSHPGSAPTKIPVGPNQVLLRGAQLRNTEWVYGVVVNAGHETKLMRNATQVAMLASRKPLTCISGAHPSSGLQLSVRSTCRFCICSSSYSSCPWCLPSAAAFVQSVSMTMCREHFRLTSKSLVVLLVAGLVLEIRR